MIGSDELTLQVTASFGVSEYRDDTRDLEQLVHEADMALFDAKRAGRNQVRAARAAVTDAQA